MSDEGEKNDKKQVYFLDRLVHKEHLQSATDDAMVARAHLHSLTSDDSSASTDLITSLCEYYLALESFKKVLLEIEQFPVVPAAEGEGEEYVIGGEQTLLLKFYVPLLLQLEQRVRGYNLSLAVH